MNIIERIRAEIERMISAHKTKNGFPKGSFCAVRIEAYNEVLGLLDTLEEPVSEDLEEAAMNYIAPIENDEGLDYINFSGRDIKDAFIEGAEWQEKRWENNRLMAQDHATEEECQREMDFVDNHIKKHHRIPTFSDAINYGIKWQKEQMLKEAVEGEVMDFSSNQPRPQVDVLLDPHKYHTGEKVKIIIVKEDGE